jgi:soluble lytic murein transglycosylase-like protein
MLCALVTSSAAQADIFRTVGPDGVISFSNNKQPGGKLYARTEPALQPRMPRHASPDRYTRYDQHIREAAALYQIPVELVRAVIKVESDFDPRANSRPKQKILKHLIRVSAEGVMVG